MAISLTNVTILGVSGDKLLGPVTLGDSLTVCDLRARVLDLVSSRNPPVYGPVYFRRITVTLFHEGELVDDGHVLKAGDVQLTAAVAQIEEEQGSFKLDGIIQQLEQVSDGFQSKCVGLYVHGSWLYGYKEPNDVDLLAIVDIVNQKGISVDRCIDEFVEKEFTAGKYQVQVLLKSDFFGKLAAMDLAALQCLFTPSSLVLRELDDERMCDVEINLPVLEKSIIGLADVKWLEAVSGRLQQADGHCKKSFLCIQCA